MKQVLIALDQLANETLSARAYRLSRDRGRHCSRWYPSSKTCNCCGHKMDTMPLDIREWDCPDCGTQHDRDLNAAKNILDHGLRDLYGFTSGELPEYRRGEEVRHASSGAFLDEAFRLFCL